MLKTRFIALAAYCLTLAACQTDGNGNSKPDTTVPSPGASSQVTPLKFAKADCTALFGATNPNYATQGAAYVIADVTSNFDNSESVVAKSFFQNLLDKAVYQSVSSAILSADITAGSNKISVPLFAFDTSTHTHTTLVGPNRVFVGLLKPGQNVNIVYTVKYSTSTNANLINTVGQIIGALPTLATESGLSRVAKLAGDVSKTAFAKWQQDVDNAENQTATIGDTAQVIVQNAINPCVDNVRGYTLMSGVVEASSGQTSVTKNVVYNTTISFEPTVVFSSVSLKDGLPNYVQATEHTATPELFLGPVTVNNMDYQDIYAYMTGQAFWSDFANKKDVLSLQNFCNSASEQYRTLTNSNYYDARLFVHSAIERAGIFANLQDTPALTPLYKQIRSICYLSTDYYPPFSFDAAAAALPPDTAIPAVAATQGPVAQATAAASKAPAQ